MAAFAIFLFSCIGFTQLYINFNYQDYMYASGSTEQNNRLLTEQHFGKDPYFILIYLYAKGDNLVTMDAFNEILLVDTFFKDFTDANGNQFANFCQVLDSNCMESPGPLYYWSKPAGIDFDTGLDDAGLLTAVNAGANTYTSTVKIDTASIFRNTTPTSVALSSNVYDLQASTASQLVYMLDPSKHPRTTNSLGFIPSTEMEWENGLREALDKQSYTHISVGMISPNSTQYDIDYYTVGDMKYIVLSIIFLVGYSFLVLGRCDQVHSRIKLNLWGLASIMLSILETFGVSQYTGIPVTTVHQLMCFLLIGVGYDDVFVMMNGFDRAQKEYPDDPALQMAVTFEHSGLGITVSSLTSFISFSSGLTMSIVMLRNFAVYAAFGIVLLWANTILIFGTFLSYHAFQVQKNEKDCCGCCTCLPFKDNITNPHSTDIQDNPNEQKDNSLQDSQKDINEKQQERMSDPNGIYLEGQYNSTLTGPNVDTNPIQGLNNDESINDNTSPKNIVNLNANANANDKGLNDDNFKDFFLNKVFRYHYNYLIKPKFMKIFNILCMFLLLYASLVGATKVERLNEFLLYLPEKALAYQVIKKQKDLTANTLPIYFYTIENADYTSVLSQSQHIQMKSLITANEYYYAGFASWYDRLYNFVDAGYCDVDGSTVALVEGVIPPTNFMACLDELLTSDPAVGHFLTRDAVTGTIINSFFQYTSVEMQTDDKPKFLDQLAVIASQGPYKTYPYSSYFPTFSMEKVMIENLLNMLVGAFVAIMTIIYLMFNNVVATLLIAVNVVQILLVVFASIHWWGLWLNIMTVIFLTMAIGIAVDFCAHIMHEYIECAGSYEQRTESALTKMGPAVTHAAISTLLGITFTILGGSFVWEAFFKTWLMIIIAGMYYSMVVMPTILTFIGPASHSNTDSQSYKDKIFKEFQNQNEQFFDDKDKQAIDKVHKENKSVNDLIDRYNMYTHYKDNDDKYILDLVQKDLVEHVHTVRSHLGQGFGTKLLEYLDLKTVEEYNDLNKRGMKMSDKNSINEQNELRSIENSERSNLVLVEIQPKNSNQRKSYD